MRSKSSARTSLLAATPWAAYTTFKVRMIHPKKWMVTYRQEDTNACEDYIRRRKYLQNIYERSGLH